MKMQQNIPIGFEAMLKTRVQHINLIDHEKTNKIDIGGLVRKIRYAKNLHFRSLPHVRLFV